MLSGSSLLSQGRYESTVARESALPQNTLAAIVFAEVLKPLTKALGPLGDTLAATVADRAFVRGAR